MKNIRSKLRRKKLQLSFNRFFFPFCSLSHTEQVLVASKAKPRPGTEPAVHSQSTGASAWRKNNEYITTSYYTRDEKRGNFFLSHDIRHRCCRLLFLRGACRYVCHCLPHACFASLNVYSLLVIFQQFSTIRIQFLHCPSKCSLNARISCPLDRSIMIIVNSIRISFSDEFSYIFN